MAAPVTASPPAYTAALLVAPVSSVATIHLRRLTSSPSVVEEINDRLCYAIQYLYKVQPVLLSSTSNTGITLSLKNNSEIGADRIANGFRAFELYKDAVIVVDFGTATTFDIVNKNGEFIGGIIAPGLTTQFASLNKSTSKLPKLDVEYIEKAIEYMQQANNMLLEAKKHM